MAATLHPEETTVPKPTNDTRIQRLDPLSPPVQVIGEAPTTSMIEEVVGDSRAAIHRILTGVVLGLSLVVILIGGSPALASLHTYHEQPGQVTHRSIQSLPDRRGFSWQAVLFRRYPPAQEGAGLQAAGSIAPDLTHAAAGHPGPAGAEHVQALTHPASTAPASVPAPDRKSTRLNSSHRT